MSKIKKIIINIVCGVLLLAAGFGTGRGLRLARTSAGSSELESGIVAAGESANHISDGLDNAAALASSADSSGRAVEEGLGVMQQSTERLGIFYDEVIRAVEADAEATEAFKRNHKSSADAAVNALDIAIQHSEQYERLIESLQQAINNSSKDSKKSK